MKVDKINKAINIKKNNDDIEIKPLYNIDKDVYIFDLIFNTIKEKKYILDIFLNSVDIFDYITINFRKYNLQNNNLKYEFVASDNREIIRVGLPFISSFILFEIKNIKVCSNHPPKIDNLKKLCDKNIPKVQEKKVLEITNFIYKRKIDTLLLARSYDYAILIINENIKNTDNFIKNIEKDFWQFKYIICWISSLNIGDVNNIKYPNFLKQIKTQKIVWCWFGKNDYRELDIDIEDFSDFWEIYYKIKGINHLIDVNKFNFGKLNTSITFVTTACVRPNIYLKSIESLKNCLGELNNFRLIINIDMIPHNTKDAIEMIKIAEKYFGEVIYNLSDEPNFVKAFKFVVEKVNTPWFFYIQDDWLFEKKFYLKDLMNHIMPYHNSIISCHLFKKDGGRNDDDKIYLSPSIMKTVYWKDIIERAPLNYSIEKLFRDKTVENPKGGMFPEYRGTYYRTDTKQMVSDLGRNWIKEIGYRKDDNYLFTKWICN